MSTTRKLPRLKDIFGPDKSPAMAEDSKPASGFGYSEPIPIDRSNIVWPARRSSRIAQD